MDASALTPTIADMPRHPVDFDHASLHTLEGVIERGIATFRDVGRALIAIRDGKKYRDGGYSTFEDYCDRRWQFGRNYAGRLMRAAEVTGALETVPAGTVLPTHEKQLRPLSSLRAEPEVMRAAWAEAVEDAGGAPTEVHVREAVRRIAGEAPPAPVERPAPVSMRLPADLEAEVHKAAAEMGVSFTQVVVQALRHWFKERARREAWSAQKRERRAQGEKL